MSPAAARVFETLRANAGRVVSCDTLCALGWPDQQDARRARGSLRNAVMDIRAHLLAENAAAIAVVPERGYAWVEVLRD